MIKKFIKKERNVKRHAKTAFANTERKVFLKVLQFENNLIIEKAKFKEKMKNTFCCACDNYHIQYKTTCDLHSLPTPIQNIKWTQPICSTTSTIISKYKHFNQTLPLKNQKYSTLTCKFCQTLLGYYIQPMNESYETTFIFNPELDLIDERRNDMIF